MKRKGCLLLLILFLIALTTMVIGSLTYTSRLDQAREDVPVGTPREVAVEILGHDAWYYQPCPDHDGALIDLFFYDSHRYNRATVIDVVYHLNEDGEYEVAAIWSSGVELWHYSYSDCIDRSRFDE